jgi:glycosyltransferase involved in cell wall biosynthesis
MRIMHILEATLGGTRRYINDLFRVSDPHDQHLLVYGTARADGAFGITLEAMRSAGWQTEALDLRREINLIHDLSCARQLRRIVVRFRPDIIHAHSSKAGAVARIAVFGMSERPSIVYSPHAIAVRLGLTYHLIERVLGPQTQILAAISPSECAELRALYLVPKHKLRVIPPTVRADEFVPTDREIARARLGLPDGPLVVGVGRLTAQKDPLAFVRVIQAVSALRGGTRALWVGDGELRGDVERAIAAAGLAGAVTITGWQDDVRPYLAAADVFLSTSAYESFGYATAEALAMKRPAIGSDIGGTTDILMLDRERVLYKPGDDADAAAKVVALLDDAPLAREIAARGCAHVLKEFSPEVMQRSLRDVYRAALNIVRPPTVLNGARKGTPRIAIVSDPLVQRGGAERVVEAMARVFADAPIFALLYSPTSGPPALRERITTSGLGRIPGAARRHRMLLPFFPAAIESFDLGGFDVVLSSHHTVAKGLIRGAETVHVCYCHTPMRALWERTHEELATLPAPLRPFGASLFRKLRVWDLATVQRVDVFIANSETTSQRILKHYGRDSVVVYPPIDTLRFTPSDAPAGDYYLVASRLVPYKRVELALEAAQRAQRRLIIVGDGPGRAALLRRGAELRGHVSDDELIELMRGARALIFPQLEDFGMTPLEMMACGRPVIAYARGGAAETVIDGETGVLVGEQTPEAFVEGIRRFESLRISAAACRSRAELFSYERFARAISAAVWDAYGSSPRANVRYTK